MTRRLPTDEFKIYLRVIGELSANHQRYKKAASIVSKTDHGFIEA
jgi:hypothetical protein